MTKKSLGQIARDEYAKFYGFPPWWQLTSEAQDSFERIAAAVARAVKRRGKK